MIQAKSLACLLYPSSSSYADTLLSSSTEQKIEKQNKTSVQSGEGLAEREKQPETIKLSNVPPTHPYHVPLFFLLLKMQMETCGTVGLDIRQ